MYKLAADTRRVSYIREQNRIRQLQNANKVNDNLCSENGAINTTHGKQSTPSSSNEINNQSQENLVNNANTNSSKKESRLRNILAIKRRNKKTRQIKIVVTTRLWVQKQV
jgi:hypothetical protein